MPHIGQLPLSLPSETNLARARENINLAQQPFSRGIRINPRPIESMLIEPAALTLLVLPPFANLSNQQVLPTFLPAFGHSRQGALHVQHQPSVNCKINSTRKKNFSNRP